jgi:peptidoglycan/LPS O-acetylase OafA/YrhL
MYAQHQMIKSSTRLSHGLDWLRRFFRAVSFRPDPAGLQRILERSQQRHVPELDGIRGYACLSIVVLHCLTGITTSSLGRFAWPIQEHTQALFLAGVDCFFVLSGYLIGGILMDSRGEPHYFKRFWIRRIGRIIPVLYLLLFSYVVVVYLRQRFGWQELDLWLLLGPTPPLWTYATFMQSYSIAEGGVGGPRWLGITWSLAIEEQFYMFFPILVYYLSRRGLTIAAGVLIVLTPFIRSLVEVIYGNWYSAYVLPPSRFDGLMFGVLVAIIIRNRAALVAAIKMRYVLDFVILVLLYQVTIDGHYIRLWFYPTQSRFPPFHQTAIALLFALVILRVFLYQDNIVNRVWRLKFLGGIGLISYGLYMYHQAVNGLIHAFVFKQEPTIQNMPQLVAGFVVIAIAIGLAVLSYTYMEKPIRVAAHRLSKKYEQDEPKPVAAGA